MDDFGYISQERLQNLWRNAVSSSHNALGGFRDWKEQFRENLSAIRIRYEAWPIQTRIAETLQYYAHRMKASWIAVQCRKAWNRCICFLLLEVTQAHMWFGVACFAIGGLLGMTLGRKVPESCVATPKMRAIVANGYEGLQCITFEDEYEAPRLYKPSQILVQVKAAAIDYDDYSIAKGRYKNSRKQMNKHNPNGQGDLPFILGRNCSGVVAAVGKKVSSLEPGDEVWLSLPSYSNGALAEYVVAEEIHAAPKPLHLSHEGAAALSGSICRVWDSFVTKANLNEFNTAGKRAYIHSGTSGEGLVAIQIISAWGGHVTTTAPFRALDLVKSLGADDVIIEDSEDGLEGLQKFDIIFMPLKDEKLEIDVLSYILEENGIIISHYEENIPEEPTGFFWSPLFFFWTKIQQILLMKQSNQIQFENAPNVPLVEVTPLVNSGQLKAVINRTFAPQQAETAFTHSIEQGIIGKIILKFVDSLHIHRNF